jgi:uncharacterized protein YcbK (DUF882 family)
VSPPPAPSLKARFVVALIAIVLVVLATRVVLAFRAFVEPGGSATGRDARALTAPADDPDSAPTRAVARMSIPDSLMGRSGALRFATLTPSAAVALPGFLTTFGEQAIHAPGVHFVRQEADSFALITLRGFADKRGDYVNGYRLGRWPAERWLMARNYFNPDGFVEVTPENASLRVSRHFVLGDFVTHDQEQTWPKYVVLEVKLIDKLELVLQDMASHGYSVDRVVVLSGFRAPYYNERGVGEGMARASRHQYGDAADILIDADRDGRMDDLNHDGTLDLRDISPITDAIERVERRYPQLLGGLGTYAAMGPRGPFAHVDVRGTSARWESGWWKKKP